MRSGRRFKATPGVEQPTAPSLSGKVGSSRPNEPAGDQVVLDDDVPRLSRARQVPPEEDAVPPAVPELQPANDDAFHAVVDEDAAVYLVVEGGAPEGGGTGRIDDLVAGVGRNERVPRTRLGARHADGELSSGQTRGGRRYICRIEDDAGDGQAAGRRRQPDLVAGGNGKGLAPGGFLQRFGEEHRALGRLERELDLVRRTRFELDYAAAILRASWHRAGVEPQIEPRPPGRRSDGAKLHGRNVGRRPLGRRPVEAD